MVSNPDRRTILKGMGGAGAFLAVGGVGTVGAREGASAEKNLVEKTIALNSSGPYAGQFDTLIDAVDPRLTDLLTGNRQLTVFAPVDDPAFDQLGFDTTNADDVPVNILAYHVAPGRRYAKSVINSSKISTLNGSLIDVDEELAGNIVATNVEASNGVIHAIDTVLLP